MTDPYAPQTAVPQGYLPPADAYLQPMVAGPNPDDPLVNPPHAGINGWFSRIGGVFKRGWKPLLAIFAITRLLPNIGLAVIAAVATGLMVGGVVEGRIVKIEPDVLPVGVPVLIIGGVAGLLLFTYFQMTGYAAATYAATRQAAGYEVRLGEALGFGFRRGLGLFGWQILVVVLIGLGFVACILPGIYVFAATALVGPILLFERRSPAGRSFSIFHNALGRVLGRLALIMVATLVASGFTTVFDEIGATAAGSTGELSVVILAAVISSLLGIVIDLPLTMLTFSGILLTYTEQRGWEGPASARSLADELTQ